MEWRAIGVLLGVHNGKLDSIESEWPTNLKWCCDKMLETWLEIDTAASWNKIKSVIASLSGYPCDIEGEYSIILKLNRLAIHFIAHSTKANIVIM